MKKSFLYFVILFIFIFGAFARGEGLPGFAEASKDGLIFYAGFDKDAKAVLAKGNPEPVIKGRVVFDEGYKGNAIITGNNFITCLEYENKGNFNIEQGTVSLWLKPIDWLGTQGKAKWFNIFMQGDGSGKGYFGLEFQRFNQPELELLFYSGSFSNRDNMYITFRSSAEFQNKLWSHIAFTWDKEEVKLYVNGEFRGSAQITASFSVSDLNSKTFRLGTGGEEHTAIDEFCVWKTPLNASEIREVYQKK